MTRSFAAAIVAAALAAAVTAQNWEVLSLNPGQFQGQLAYDSHRDRLVTVFASGPGSQLREWDGATWLTVNPPTTPIFGGTRLAYDPVRREVVLFGNSRTWLFDGAAWRDGGIGPVHHSNANAHAWDAVRQVLVHHDPFTGMTTEWNGTQWRVAGPVLGTSFLVNLGFDPVRGQVIGFAGSTAVRAFDGTNWNTLTGTNVPFMPGAMGLCTDPVRNRLLAYGGNFTGTPSNVLWEWDGTTWNNIGSGPPRDRGGIARHVGSGKLVLFGGSTDNVQVTETWGFDTQFRLLEESPRLRLLVTDPGRGRLVGIGDNATFNAPEFTFEWAGGAWQRMAGPHARFGSLVYDPARAVVVALENDIAYPETRVWFWTGAAWQLQSPPNPAPWQPAQSLCFDQAHGVLLMFGMQGTFGWDGATWTRYLPAHYPALAANIAFQTSVFDPSTNVVRLIAYTGTWQEWQWDGTDWSQATTTAVPQSDGKLLVNAANGRVTYVAGNGTFERQGNAWIQVADSPIGAGATTSDLFDAGLRGWAPGTWVARIGIAPAHVAFGTGCSSGSAGPWLAGRGSGTTHGSDLRLDLHAAASTLAAVYLDAASASVPLGGGCTLLLLNPAHAFTGVSGPSGFLSFPVAVPPLLSLRGFVVYAQGVVLDTVGPLFGVAALTGGVAMRIGD